MDVIIIYTGKYVNFSCFRVCVSQVGLNGRDLIVDELLYKKGLTNFAIAEALKELGVGNEEVIADSAEPKSIVELFELGINVKSAIKGADSVRVGINKVREYNLKVTSRSRNAIRELKHYKWKMDRNDEPLNEPVKLFDHLLDGVRYVVQTKLVVRKKRMWGVRRLKL